MPGTVQLLLGTISFNPQNRCMKLVGRIPFPVWCLRLITKVTYPRACRWVEELGFEPGESAAYGSMLGFISQYHHLHCLSDLRHKELSISELLFPHWENEIRMILPFSHVAGDEFAR